MAAQPLRTLEDGMTSDAIHSLVDEREEAIRKERHREFDERDRALDQRLEQHKREMTEIVTPAVDKIEGMREDVCLLVGNEKSPGLVQQVLNGQEAAARKSRIWRRSDVRFRKEALEEIAGNRAAITNVAAKTATLDAKVDNNHAEVIVKLDSINWLVKTSQGLRKVGDGVLFLNKRGKVVWTMVGTLLIAWTATMQFIHNMMPRTEHWVEVHHRIVLWGGLTVLTLVILVALTKAEEPSPDKPTGEAESKPE